MNISYNTQVLNFLLACFKKLKTLKKALYETSIILPSGDSLTPDLFCFFIENKDNFYSAFEFKQRGYDKITNEDLQERLIPQYQKYKTLKVEDLDQNIVPKIISSELFINYLFINTELSIINDIINQIPIEKEIYVYSMKLNDHSLEEIQSEEGTSNHILMNNILDLSKIEDYWKKIYIPFTLNDIVGIKGKNGNKVDIPRFAGIIITNKLIQFIVNRKITQESSNFTADHFIDFLFREFIQIISIGEDEKKAFKRKIILFLNWFAEDLIQEINISEIIRKIAQNKYNIILRKTETLEDRCIDIRNQAIAFFQQLKITEFLQ